MRSLQRRVRRRVHDPELPELQGLLEGLVVSREVGRVPCLRSVEGDLDLRGFLGVDESVRKGFQVIRGTVTLTTNADAATVEKLKGAVDAHCPMCATISEKIPISLKVVKA